MENKIKLRCPKCKSDELVEIVETEEYIDVKTEELLDKYYSQDFPEYICKNCGKKIPYDHIIKKHHALSFCNISF